jgi:hypothetical protein
VSSRAGFTLHVDAWILTVVLFVAGGFAAVLVWNYHQLCRFTPPEETFSEARWATYGQGARGGLVMDLVRSKRLDGQTKETVTTMLGPTSSTGSPLSLRYPVGGVPCSMTSASLDIEFDQSGRIVNYTVRPD